VAISYNGSPELTRSVRVSAEGQIRLPMLTRAIPAPARVPREMRAPLRSLAREKILVDPVVTVTVAE